LAARTSGKPTARPGRRDGQVGALVGTHAIQKQGEVLLVGPIGMLADRDAVVDHADHATSGSSRRWAWEIATSATRSASAA
jgi:hypothetical protein